jgi:hypothetical protein
MHRRTMAQRELRYRLRDRLARPDSRVIQHGGCATEVLSGALHQSQTRRTSPNIPGCRTLPHTPRDRSVTDRGTVRGSGGFLPLVQRCRSRPRSRLRRVVSSGRADGAMVAWEYLIVAPRLRKELRAHCWRHHLRIGRRWCPHGYGGRTQVHPRHQALPPYSKHVNAEEGPVGGR